MIYLKVIGVIVLLFLAFSRYLKIRENKKNKIRALLCLLIGHWEKVKESRGLCIKIALLTDAYFVYTPKEAIILKRYLHSEKPTAKKNNRFYYSTWSKKKVGFWFQPTDNKIRLEFIYYLRSKL